MKRLNPVLLVVALLCLAACAATGPPLQPTSDGAAVQRQVLIMLRQAPPHFRPDNGYGGSYDALAGSEARRRLAQRLAMEYGLELVADWPMASLAVDCYLMQTTGDPVPPRVMEKLTHDDRIESAQPVNIFHSLGHNDALYPLQPAAKLWHLDELHQLATGKNVLVAELDSGVETTHPDLRGQVATKANFVDGNAYVAEWHGTAVAGIIAAKSDDGIGIAGVAPGAKLMALRACWQESGRQATALCSSFTLAKALQFALDGHAEVINMSIGGPRDRLLARLLDAALAKDVTVVAAVDPDSHNGGFPASHPGVIAVADEQTGASTGHARIAPGRDVPTTVPDARWDFVNGSSFAAAHVSGLAALLHERIPGIKPAQILDAMESEEPHHAADRGPALIDACATLRRATGTCACDCNKTREAGLLRQQ